MPTSVARPPRQARRRNSDRTSIDLLRDRGRLTRAGRCRANVLSRYDHDVIEHSNRSSKPCAGAAREVSNLQPAAAARPGDATVPERSGDSFVALLLQLPREAVAVATEHLLRHRVQDLVL